MIHEVRFEGSYPSVSHLPRNGWPEFAFVGRSNVGKSSLINLLTDRKQIARVSKQPGKTQSINLYIVDEQWALVDLPGYGYARESKKKRAIWQKMVENYLVSSQNLQVAFVLVDINIPPQKRDIDFINWIGKNHVPFCIIYTKTDKLKSRQLKTNRKVFCEAMLEYWEWLPEQFAVSAVDRSGKKEVLQYIEKLAGPASAHPSTKGPA